MLRQKRPIITLSGENKFTTLYPRLHFFASTHSLYIYIVQHDQYIRLHGLLSESEADYFEALVHFGRAKTERERKFYFDRLFSTSSVKTKRLEAHRYEFFQKWYYTAVWSSISCVPFQGNYRELAERCMPAITVWDAKRAVKLLSALGLIEKDARGVYRTTDLNLTTGEKWHSQAIERYQREMIRLAGESLDSSGKQERDISTVTLCVNEKAMPEIREHIRQFRSSLVKMVNGYRGTERVYQLNVQLFPLSRGSGGNT